MHYDPPVIISKTVFMQRASDYVRAGLSYFCQGEIEAPKVARLAHKFARYYRTDLGGDRNQRARAKARGEGSAILLLYPVSAGSLAWLLLVSPPTLDHPAHRLEQLASAFDRRTRIRLRGYELVLRTRPGAERPALTWRYDKVSYELWRARIIEVVRRRDACAIRQAVWSLYRTPGFAGSREQVGKLVTLLRAEARRRFGSRWRVGTPPRLHYVERVRTRVIGLSMFLATAARIARAERIDNDDVAERTGSPP
jgi:hypothetical protein